MKTFSSQLYPAGDHSRHRTRRILWRIHAQMRIIPLLVLAAQLAISDLCVAQHPCKSTVVGDLRIDHFVSKIYGGSMTVRIWLPPGYSDPANATHKYPTLYLLDGQTAFDECTAFHGEHELKVDEAVTRLIEEHKIPPIIVVGIDSTEHRAYEYSPYKDTITMRALRSRSGNSFLPSSRTRSYLSFPHITVYQIRLPRPESGERR